MHSGSAQTRTMDGQGDSFREIIKSEKLERVVFALRLKASVHV